MNIIYVCIDADECIRAPSQAESSKQPRVKDECRIKLTHPGLQHYYTLAHLTDT